MVAGTKAHGSDICLLKSLGKSVTREVILSGGSSVTPPMAR
jgi:hypothetical protein